jgi:hypothetical protein
VLGDRAQPLGAVHADVGVGAHEHAEVPQKAAHRPMDGSGGRRCSAGWRPPARHARHDRVRQEVDQVLGDADRARAGPAAAVGRAEGLVQVEVHHVDPDVARTHDPEQGVHIGAVAVHQPAAAVDDLDDLLDLLLEQAQRVGVGDHHADDLVADAAAQRVEIDVAAFVRGQLDDPQCRSCSWSPGWCRGPSRAPGSCRAGSRPGSRW